MSDSTSPTNVTSGVDLPPTQLFKKPLKRSMFGDHDVFEVCADTFCKCIQGKNRFHRWDKYIDDDSVEEIKEFVKSNPKKAVLLQNSETKGMVYVRKP